MITNYQEKPQTTDTLRRFYFEEAIKYLQNHHRAYGVQLYVECFLLEEDLLTYDSFEVGVLSVFENSAVLTQFNDYLCPRMNRIEIFRDEKASFYL
ncbi:hypothetical protein BCT47_21690 [Vibrio splendidus]|nr:hypothetical protein BCT47_21690 [Vibrio splendidus]PTO81216.1 hypothetical protein CWN93_14850 [Vibrio splendidus]